MKKIVLFLLTQIFISPIFAEVFFEPEWEDFCPNKYANIDTNKTYITGRARYWAERRKEFEKRLEKCNNVPTEMKNACYSNLRAIENSKSQVYSQDRRDRVLRTLLLNSRF